MIAMKRKQQLDKTKAEPVKAMGEAKEKECLLKMMQKKKAISKMIAMKRKQQLDKKKQNPPKQWVKN